MQPQISIDTGVLHGVRVGDVMHYRGIPYAQARRFEAPTAPSAWQGVRDATSDGPVCPQPASRLAMVMGEPPHVPQHEDCLSLSVAAKVSSSDRKRPVLVWLHGGAYVVGAGSYDWYRPDALVNDGDVVVVNVNYRLGLFGYLKLADVSPGNLGLLDQLESLRWVQRNIAAFGGDPELVTVFGESAGAHSVTALMSFEATRGLFRRVILQSGHLGVGFTSEARAEQVARTLQYFLGAADPRTAPIEALLAAQTAAIEKLGAPAGLNSVPAFGPIAGVTPLPQPAHSEIATSIVQRDVDMLIGSTRDEMRAFFDSSPVLIRLRAVPGIGNAALRALTSFVTARVFGTSAAKLADAQLQAGARVFLYRFDGAPAATNFGACHTLELPFVFGNEAAWRGSPMLAGARWDEIDALGRQMRRAWTQFARSGDPNTADDARDARDDRDVKWAPHASGAAPGRVF